MIEFSDDTSDETPDEEILDGGRPPLRRPLRVVIGAVLVAAVGVAVVLTLRNEPEPRKRAAPAPSTSASSSDTTFTIPPHVNACQLTPDGLEQCFLDHLPRAVRTAVRAAFPGAHVVGDSIGMIDNDGRLINRHLSADAGARKLTVQIDLGTVDARPYRVQDAPGVRITSLDTALSHGRHVYIEVIDENRKAVPRAALKRLARDRRLLATA